MHALLIAESTPKLMRLASFARTTHQDLHWKSITTGPFQVAVDRFDFTRRQPRLKLKHRVQLNRIVAMAAEADTIYLAMDPTPRGDLLAADLAEQLLDRYPDRQVYRLRIVRLTARDFSRAMEVSVPLNRREADPMRVSRVLNFLASTRIETLTGRPSGRAVLPLLSELAGRERPGEGRLRVRLAGGAEFVSQFGPTELVAELFGRVRGEVPSLTVERERQRLEPPDLYGVWSLQQAGCRLLGARSIEVARQMELLYQAGYLAVDWEVDEPYGRDAHRELEGFGDAPGPLRCGRGIVPVNLRCLPSDVPKPVRPVYRLCWANTLCSYGRPMDVEVETASFVVDGLRFEAKSVVPLSVGFDRSSFGLFYRRGRIGASRAVEDARMFGAGPFESELLESLALRFDNPARVLKAATNLEYIGFDGIEVVVLEPGRQVLELVGRSLPQLLDGGLFNSTEQFLRSEWDANELIEPWSRWAESVSRAVKKREVAYLR